MMNEMLLKMYKSSQNNSPISSDIRPLNAIQNGLQQVPDGSNASSGDLFRDGFTIDRRPSFVDQSAPVAPPCTRPANDLTRVNEICEISPDDCVIIDDEKTAGSIGAREEVSRGCASAGSSEGGTLPCGSMAEARTPTTADVNGVCKKVLLSILIIS